METSRWMCQLLSILLLGELSSSCVDVDGYRLRSESDAQAPATQHSGGETQQSIPPDAVALSSTGAGSGGLGVAGSGSGRLTVGAAGKGGATGRTAAGGATTTSGHCQQERHSSCEEMTDVADCDGLRGCVYAVREHCAEQHELTCSALSRTYSNCNAMTGCTSSGVGRCTSQEQREDCVRIVEAKDCDAAVGCLWIGESGSCLGTPIPCAQSTTKQSCLKRYNCKWSTFECSGTPTACELLETNAGCITSSNCVWIDPS